jgi:pimeloyl-ACP methyl ester carboxylesterase
MSDRELAVLCADSYPPDKITPAPLELRPDVTTIGSLGALAFIFEGDPALVVLPGTHDVAGWAENLYARWAALPCAWGHVHAGFADCTRSLVRRLVYELKLRSVVLAGHSLGGVEAICLAAELRDRGFKVARVVTFGSPRPGDDEFASRYRLSGLTAITTRYVHKLDPVALAPGYLPGYRHVCRPTWFDGRQWREGYAWGASLRLAASMCWDVAKLAARFATVGLISTGKSIFRRLWAHHAIERYVEALP